jgi:hypothetical protein
MTKHPGGRPTEYRPEHTTFAKAYVTTFTELGDAVPTIEGLCDELGISKQCCYEWQERHPEFGDACKRILAKQGRILQNQGLLGKFAPVITKLLLSANHDKREKTDTTSDGKAVGTVDQLIAAVNAARK